MSEAKAKRSVRTRENVDTMVVHMDGIRFFKNCAHPYEKNEPSGYIAWHEWAEEHMKTHEHTRCPDCGLYAACKRVANRE